MECFEALRRADIYAIGLLYWEVCRRTMSNGIAEEYKGEWSPLEPFLNLINPFKFSTISAILRRRPNRSLVRGDEKSRLRRQLPTVDPQPLDVRPTPQWNGSANEGVLASQPKCASGRTEDKKIALQACQLRRELQTDVQRRNLRLTSTASSSSQHFMV